MLHGLLHLLGFDHETDGGRMASLKSAGVLFVAAGDGDGKVSPGLTASALLSKAERGRTPSVL